MSLVRTGGGYRCTLCKDYLIQIKKLQDNKADMEKTIESLKEELDLLKGQLVLDEININSKLDYLSGLVETLTTSRSNS